MVLWWLVELSFCCGIAQPFRNLLFRYATLEIYCFGMPRPHLLCCWCPRVRGARVCWLCFFVAVCHRYMYHVEYRKNYKDYKVWIRGKVDFGDGPCVHLDFSEDSLYLQVRFGVGITGVGWCRPLCSRSRRCDGKSETRCDAKWLACAPNVLNRSPHSLCLVFE